MALNDAISQVTQKYAGDSQVDAKVLIKKVVRCILTEVCVVNYSQQLPHQILTKYL